MNLIFPVPSLCVKLQGHFFFLFSAPYGLHILPVAAALFSTLGFSTWFLHFAGSTVCQSPTPFSKLNYIEAYLQLCSLVNTDVSIQTSSYIHYNKSNWRVRAYDVFGLTGSKETELWAWQCPSNRKNTGSPIDENSSTAWVTGGRERDRGIMLSQRTFWRRETGAHTFTQVRPLTTIHLQNIYVGLS